MAPSDFYLSGHVKGCLASRSFVDAEELCETVRTVLDSIEKVILQAVFLEWMDRPRKYIQTDGERTEQAQKRFLQIRLLFTQSGNAHFLAEHPVLGRLLLVCQMPFVITDSLLGLAGTRAPALTRTIFSSWPGTATFPPPESSESVMERRQSPGQKMARLCNETIRGAFPVVS
jgi:hypothetical protein